MFYKDIDSWGKGKLRRVTILVGLLYFLFSTVAPIIIVCSQYSIFESSSFKVTAIGLGVIIFVATAGLKAMHWVISMIPEATKKQQVLRYSIEMVIALLVPAFVIWICQLVKANMDLAISTITYCCFSYMVAIIIENMFFKSLKYQWSMEGKVDEMEKLDRIKAARRR